MFAASVQPCFKWNNMNMKIDFNFLNDSGIQREKKNTVIPNIYFIPTLFIYCRK